MASQSPLPGLGEYHIRAFSAAAGGLLASDVRDIAQTADGYLYLAQARGLARYNGYSFEKVPLPGLNSAFIDELHVDRRDRLWIRTRGSEVGYLKDGRFTLLPAAPGLLYEFWETADATIWARSDSGVVRIVADGDSPYLLIRTRDGLPHRRVVGVFDLPTSERVVVTAVGLARLENATPTTLRAVSFGPRCEVAADVRLAGNSLWIPCRSGNQAYTTLRYHDHAFTHFATREERLHLDDFDLSSGEARFDATFSGWNLEFRSASSSGEYRDYQLRRALLGTDGSRWLAVGKRGSQRDELVRKVGDRLEAIPLRAHLEFSNIHQLMNDHEGSVWVTTDRGLFQLTRRKLFSFGTADGLAEGFTTAILQTRDGAVWVGTWGGGLHRFVDGRLDRRFDTSNGLPTNNVRALFEDASGVLWVGGAGGFAAVRSGRIELSQTLPAEVRAFAIADPTGRGKSRLWIGTATQLLLRDGPAFVEHRPDFWRRKQIWALHADSAGGLWIGSEQGLYRLHNDTLHSFGKEHGLRSTSIVAIHDQSDGSLWFSSYEHGLHRYRNGRFTALTTEHGLHANGVWRMLNDAAEGIWLSSDLGISRVDKARLSAVADAVERGERVTRRLQPLVFTDAEGMPSRESNRASPGGYVLRDGRLLFNSVEGVIVIDPHSIVGGPVGPLTRIEAVIADGTSIEAADGRTARVPAGTRQVTFDFAALSFITPEQNRYRYRLDGYDRDWMEAGTRHTASYTNLPPGEYTFRVQGASAGGTWNEAGDLFGFFVAPFVWQTWWFRISAAAALISLGLAAHRYRTRRLLEIERLRLRIASDLHDDVGSNLSSIALLSEILHNQSRLDDVQRRQISRINQAAQETISSLRDIIWLVDPQHNELNDLLRKMRITAADLLNGTSHTFETSISLPAQQPGMTFMRNLLLIYKEALHNIARHSQASHASIRMDETGGRLVLEIEDDGLGFDQARATTGRGLENMRRRAEQAGGKLDIESRPGGGTRIRFSARMA